MSNSRPVGRIHPQDQLIAWLAVVLTDEQMQQCRKLADEADAQWRLSS
jgi:hypothetical protein